MDQFFLNVVGFVVFVTFWLYPPFSFVHSLCRWAFIIYNLSEMLHLFIYLNIIVSLAETLPSVNIYYYKRNFLFFWFLITSVSILFQNMQMIWLSIYISSTQIHTFTHVSVSVYIKANATTKYRQRFGGVHIYCHSVGAERRK